MPTVFLLLLKPTPPSKSPARDRALGPPARAQEPLDPGLRLREELDLWLRCELDREGRGDKPAGGLPQDGAVVCFRKSQQQPGSFSPNFYPRSSHAPEV